LTSRPIIEEKKIEDIIRNIIGDSFTVLDFMKTMQSTYPKEWGNLVERFGLFGSKRRYTVATYLSNRLDVYSQKPNSILVPLIRYREGKSKDYRKTSEEERKAFGGPWIAVYKKKPRKRKDQAQAKNNIKPVNHRTT
jgi:hypothetical protein